MTRINALTTTSLNEGDARYLKLDGSNANTDIDIASYSITTTGYGTFTSVYEWTPTLLLLDQTYPQTVTGGAPIFNEGIVILTGKRLVFDG